MKNLENGTKLDEAYTPFHICCKQTYDQLVLDESLHDAKFSEDHFILNNWNQANGWQDDDNISPAPNLEHFETHNKNDPLVREELLAILAQWKNDYESNVKNARSGQMLSL